MSSPNPDVLRGAHRQGRWRRRATALLLVAPLFLFLVVNFLLPVGYILLRSVDDREVLKVLPRTLPAIAAWNGEGLPDAAVFEALRDDLRQAQRDRTVTVAAVRLNANRAGFQALVARTARTVAAADPKASSATDALIAIDARWGQTEWWRAVRQAASPYTPIYLLSGLDLTLDGDGSIVATPESRRLFVTVWLRTFWMAGVITGVCVLLGYPLAHLLATARRRVANIVLVLVLLPFWTSLLVRTSAWLALLQREGVVNDLAQSLGLLDAPAELIHNRFGVYVTMAHVLLPYVVLPLSAVMKRIPPTYMRAANSLGANSFEAFLRVYLPLTLPGVGGGAVMVFILAVGFYITPALVGGPNDQMISYYIAYYTNESLNWNAAAALSVLLLLFTVIAFTLFSRAFGINRLKVR